MKLQVSLLCSKQPATGLVTEPHKPSLHSYHVSLALASTLIELSHLPLGLPSSLIPSDFQCSTPCPSHPPRLSS